MDGKANELAPRARQKGLIVRDLDGELLIYDRERDVAHALNGTAAAVWKLCDGGTTVADMVPLLNREPGTRVDEHTIYRGLADLGKQNLLLEQVADPGSRRVLSRRTMLKSGVAAAVAIPVITSLAVSPGIALAACSSCTSGSCPGGSPNSTGLHQGCCCSADSQCCGNNGGRPGCCYTANGTTAGDCGICSTIQNSLGQNITCCQPGFSGTNGACGNIVQNCVES